MKTWRKRTLRNIAAAAVIVLLLSSLMSDSAYFLTGTTFLAGIQLIPALIRLTTDISLFAAAAVFINLILTLLFGRLYCGAFCPLGTLQDLLSSAGRRIRRFFVSPRAGKKKTSIGYRKELPYVRFPLLAAAAAFFVMGSPALLNILDPYGIFGRFAYGLGRPFLSFFSSLLLEPLKKIGIYASPQTALIHPRIFFIVFFVFIFLAAASALRGRFFCNLLCPAGSLLRIISSRPLFRLQLKEELCTRCLACESVCPAECINAVNGYIDQGRCVRCFACQEICPVSAIRFEKYTPEIDPSRRRFLKHGFRGLGLVLFGSLSIRKTIADAIGYRPVSNFPRALKDPVEIDGRTVTELPPAVAPGAVSFSRFGSLCISCHLCASLCPTQVLRPALSTRGLSGVFQPVLDYHAGFCEYDCTLCGSVCPTGAILPLEKRKKQQTRIGRSHLIKERCVVYTKGTSCGACAEVCPTHAVHMIPYRPSLTQPETDDSLCIGCGNCQFACPVEGTKAILVEGLIVHEEVDDRKDSLPPPPKSLSPGPPEEKEFPF